MRRWISRRKLTRAAAAVGARSPDALEERIATLQEELRTTKQRLKAGVGGGRPKPAEIAGRAESIGDVPLVAWSGELASIDELKALAKDVRGALPSGVVALALDVDEPQLFVTVSDDLVARGISAGSLVQAAMPHLDGRGGGRPQMAQGKGSRRDGLDAAFASIRDAIRRPGAA